MKRESHIRVSQHNAFELRKNVGEFGLVGLKKFTAGRNVEKQVSHCKICPFGTCHRLLTDDPTAFDGDGNAEIVPTQLSLQFHLCHCSYGSKCFATKAHGA